MAMDQNSYSMQPQQFYQIRICLKNILGFNIFIDKNDVAKLHTVTWNATFTLKIYETCSSYFLIQ